MIFATNSGLKRISTAKYLSIDGTFKVTPTLSTLAPNRLPFTQLVTIHTHYQNEEKETESVPSVFILLVSKLQQHYTSILKKLKEILNNNNLTFNYTCKQFIYRL